MSKKDEINRLTKEVSRLTQDVEKWRELAIKGTAAVIAVRIELEHAKDRIKELEKKGEE